MKVYTYSEARRRLAEVLNIARSEDVIIKRRGGETFTVSYRERVTSPFDVPGIDTRATTQDILDAVRESRSGYRFAWPNAEDAK
ncbi:MAG: type II toxin-antitoxin system prevent-host-death family antitoxin [Caldilineaceae bacterium]|nr:type II toxin-antitoxin system prevent-host-death family antitoxin [Caldilineaceae bacterium]